ncbi:MAG: PorP/SprF family type IX secretion system membrane protein [bacterium]|nr:PorP/SprF family type IX secretion system membrane protein [bacterium]
MKLNRYILLVLVGMSAFQSVAQDIHFSQFNGSLLNLTPGYTGLFNGDYRVGAIFKSQWQSVPVNYKTFSMSGEKVFRPKEMEKDKLGIGFLFNSDRAGDARYGTTQAYMTGSYIYSGREDTTLSISIGMSAGWCQVGFDYTKMTFDNQYDGLAYNSGLGSNENFTWVSRNFLDINGGLVIQKTFNQIHHVSYALGVYHLTSPKVSYQGNDLSRLDFKFSNCISYNTPIKANTDIILEALLSNQGKNYEIIPHASLKYYLEKRENKAILGGLCFRARDAIVLRMGYTNQTLQSGISYDINISKFTPATNHRGGFEIFINYVIKVKPAFIARKRPCPMFI